MISLSSLFLIAVAAAQIAVPPLKARVTDLTGTLNAQQRSALEQTLAEFEHRKGAQVAVLMVSSTQPETVDQYAVRVQESWKLGRKGVDDGVLLVVAKNDRKLRIEVGYGLEGILPDAIAKRIIEEDIVPRFKQNDFYGGVRAGTDRIMRVIEGEKLPPPRARGPVAASKSFNPEWLFALFVFVAIGGSILRAIFGRFFGAGIVGAVCAVVGWAFLGSLVIGVIAALIGFLLTLFNDGRSTGSSGSGWSSGGGFSGGGFSSSDSGGFSGGGGSSGGGGASGSW